MLHITEENLGINPNGFTEFRMQYVRGSDNASIGKESSREMGAFALTVSVISGQTSLIAANNAFTAARAGKYGQGFAILAGEVRLLARQFAAAAQQIAAIAPAVKNGSAVSSAGKTFHAIVDGILEVSKNICQLSIAIENVSRGNQRIVSSSAEQHATFMQELIASSRALAHLSQEMNRAINKFVL